MGICCSKPRIKDEEEKILEKYSIVDVKELSSTCLKYNEERCSQKWYTSSVYTDKDNPQEGFNIVCCKREARILSGLEHPNIIKFIGIYNKPKNPQPILVTEEITSNLLYHLDKVETLQDTEKFKFSCAVSDGLAYLHSQRLAHLNLCTKSIFLTESLVVKITDFEYASYFSNQSTISSSSSGPTSAKFDPWIFRHDNRMFGFLPAEYSRFTYDSLDIYSFGCVVFNIFTHKPPTAEIKSRIEEISVPGVGNLVSECLHGKKESMQVVSSAIHVCSKEHYFNASEKFAQKGKVVEADIELHKLEKSDQSLNKDTDQEVSEAKVNIEKKEVQIECTAAETAIVPVGKPEICVQPSETPKSSKVQTEDKDAQAEDKNVQVQPYETPTSKVQTEDKNAQTEDEHVQTDDKQVQTGDKGVQTDDKQVQTGDKGVQTECKEVAVIPPQGDLKDQQIEKLKKMNSDLISRLTALEEQSFKFTNAFTTADEGSVIKLRDTYRSLQTNGRPAANRDHKKAYKGITYPIVDHTMFAYEEARRLAQQEFDIVSERFQSFFKLKSPDSVPSQVQRDKAMMQSQELLESFHDKPMNEKIYQMLIEKYKELTNQAPNGIPRAVCDYYSSLAKFTWDCVARPIPIIMSIDPPKFDGEIHESNEGDDEDGDDEDGDKGKFVSYIYPVLFTSNNWPREIAMKGKVKFLDAQESII